MLRLTLELLPYGSEKDKKLLKQIDIANDGVHDIPFRFGDYKVRINEHKHTETRWNQKYITNYPRQYYDALYLTYLVIRKLVHEDGNITPIDTKASRDKEASAGPGHNLLQDGLPGVGNSGYYPRTPKRG